jgi:transglutaminase-like putative cysteine protease
VRKLIADRRTTGPTTWATVASLSWMGALLVVASLSVSAAWDQPLPAVLLAAAAGVPLLAGHALISMGVSRRVAVVVLLGVLVVIVYFLLGSGSASTAPGPFRSDSATRGAFPPAAFAGALLDAVPRLLTEPRPYRVRGDLLATPILLIGLISALVGLGGNRTRAGVVLAALTIYAGGLLLTAGSADPWGLIAVLLLLLTVSGWVLLDRPSEGRRALLGVLGLMAGVGGATVVSLALVSVADGFDPRTVVEPPLVEVVTPSPLPQLGSWAANPDVELLRVSGDAVPLRLVVLDSYDGSQWSASTRFAPFGSPGRPILPAGARQREVRNKVTITGLGGQWLPAPGNPVAVSDRGALVDLATGTLLRTGGPDDTSYHVSGALDDFATDDLVNASVPASGAAGRYLDGPDLPVELATYGSLITEGAVTPYERALAIEGAVRNNRRVSAKAISGSAYWRIAAFLVGDKGEPGARIGTSEQFATSFALLARANGLPTRLVLGFKPGEPQDDGTRIIRGSDAFAWPEVYFEGVGWVPFSPSPDDDTFARDRVVRTAGPERVVGPGDSPAPTPEPAPEAERSGPPPRPAESRPWLPYAVACGVLGGPLVLLAGARVARSRRHRRQGIAGAWAEVVDGLALARLRMPPYETATGVARRTDERIGLTATSTLAHAAERVAFGPGAGTRSAAGAWPQEVKVVRSALRRTLPWWRRWWWSLDPRVFATSQTHARSEPDLQVSTRLGDELIGS